MYAGEGLMLMLDDTFEAGFFDGVLSVYWSNDACDGLTCDGALSCANAPVNVDEREWSQKGATHHHNMNR